MNKAVLTEVGVIRYQAGKQPTPGPGQLLVRVDATGICGSDLSTYRGQHPYKTPPVVLGHELCGIVEVAAGGFEVGDLVCAAAYAHCGVCPPCRVGRTNLCVAKRNLSHLGWDGSFADYVVLEPSMTYRLPAGFDPCMGALVEPLSIGLHAVRLAGRTDGRSMRIIGAGNIGLACLVTARRLGFTDITTVDIGSAKRDRALALGADWHVDVAASAYDPAPADVVIVASGHPGVLGEALAAVVPSGTIVLVSFFTNALPIDANAVVGREVTLIGSSLSVADDFRTVIAWLAVGAINPAPMITHVLPLADTATAMSMMDVGRDDIGKIVLVPGEEPWV